MCQGPRRDRRAKTSPGILKDHLLEDSPVCRRVRFSTHVTVTCIEKAEKAQEIESSESSFCKSSSRRALMHRLCSLLGCLQAEPAADLLGEERPTRQRSRKPSPFPTSRPAIEVCWDDFIMQ
ncbi:unnamed protein product [Effrenium voratum]|nr:unnamed protein product [Effrenium voratum]